MSYPAEQNYESACLPLKLDPAEAQESAVLEDNRRGSWVATPHDILT